MAENLLLTDYRGADIRLTSERREHILGHPEMQNMLPAIAETLRLPERVLLSLSDNEARLYYRRYPETPVGAKWVCVVVKEPAQGGPFVLTAYLTDVPKKGDLLWPESL